MWDVAVIGAGQAGLASGYYLKHRGLRFTILEAGDRPAGSWPRYYESLKLFSPARYSALPGMDFPGDPDRYPLRDEVATYLCHYAERFQLPVRTRTRVDRVERNGARFRITSANGETLQTRAVICASGAFGRPLMPELPGQSDYRGAILHAAQYRSPQPFRDHRMVVVGAGNSAVQIAVELAQEANVTLATREPVRFRPQVIWGRDIHFWSRATGLDALPIGPWLKRDPAGVLDTGVYQAALAANRPDRRPMFTAFTPDGVIWADGMEESVDGVICATGYRPGLDYVLVPGAFDDAGQALQRHGISLSVPGLYFVGLSRQRTGASASLRGVGPDAAHVVKHLARFLRGQGE